MTTDTTEILESRNWTGLSLRELLEAGRVGSRKAILDWVYQSLPVPEFSGYSGMRMEIDRRKAIVAEIAEAFGIES